DIGRMIARVRTGWLTGRWIGPGERQRPTPFQRRMGCARFQKLAFLLSFSARLLAFWFSRGRRRFVGFSLFLCQLRRLGLLLGFFLRFAGRLLLHFRRRRVGIRIARLGLWLLFRIAINPAINPNLAHFSFWIEVTVTCNNCEIRKF